MATSLAFGESLEKKVGLLEIHKTTFKMIPISLKTVRPFIFEEIELEKLDPTNCSMETSSSEAMKTAEQKINAMILKAAEKHTGSCNNIINTYLLQLHSKTLQILLFMWENSILANSSLLAHVLALKNNVGF